MSSSQSGPSGPEHSKKRTADAEACRLALTCSQTPEGAVRRPELEEAGATGAVGVGAIQDSVTFTLSQVGSHPGPGSLSIDQKDTRDGCTNGQT